MLSVQDIKDMSMRDRKKLQVEDVIELLFKINDENNNKIKSDIEINQLKDSLKAVKEEAAKNTAAITELQTSRNNEIGTEGPTFVQDEILVEIDKLKMEINEIQQYLRINNVEVVGIPSSISNDDDDQTEDQLDTETALVDFFSNVLNVEISAADIDICHEIPSRRVDAKRVIVCRFISRKHKIDILNARKNKRDANYKGSLIYVNDHLSPKNREIFAFASQKRKEENYKYLWTKHGDIHLRKTDNSEVFVIKSLEQLHAL